MLHEKLVHGLHALHSEMEAKGELLSLETLQRCYETFRQRFGPDVLRRLEGQQLLDAMKGPGKEGLVYWLEFKNDDELPQAFGSIAGGSALKYGVYRRRETGAWTTGSPAEQREISVAEALDVARAHRDQLLAASERLAALPKEPEDQEYTALQRELILIAPDVQDSAWAHKYLSLIHPDKLDDLSHPPPSRRCPVSSTPATLTCFPTVFCCRACDLPAPWRWTRPFEGAR